MRIRILSDLHLEFRPDWGSWIKSLGTDCDALVLAGDIHVYRELGTALGMFAQRFRHVVFVAGNHEYYNAKPRNLVIKRNLLQRENLHWLENEVAVIDGVRFVGCTLWFREIPEDVPSMYAPPQAPKWAMNDFRQIKDFEPWVYEQNRLSRAFLEESVQPGDVVVTHHLPHHMSVPRQYENSPLNPFFLCDMEHVIDRQKPRLWIHGHTHTSCDYMLGDTRVVCNPYGYYGHEINTEFDPKKTVEVP